MRKLLLAAIAALSLGGSFGMAYAAPVQHNGTSAQQSYQRTIDNEAGTSMGGGG
jgi:hypothetical protein